jgi:formylglycine-generating enzyme required for sulfatase activity
MSISRLFCFLVASILCAPAPTKAQSELRPEQMRAGSEFKECDACPTMVVVPRGQFVMGSPKTESGHQKEEGPQHEVTIPVAFAVGKFEILKSEYETFATETARKMEGCWAFGENSGLPEEKADLSFRNPGYEQTDKHPVACMSWEDARAYVEWLSKKTGANYRLLSEAEWEYSARAGSQQRFSYGDDPAQLCRSGNGADADASKHLPKEWTYYHCSDGYVYSATGGVYEPNSFGLYDMTGNIWEWVEDCYHDSYVGAPTDGTAWTKKKCQEHILRGGSWSHDAQYLRLAYRCGSESIRYYLAGFRVARTP